MTGKAQAARQPSIDELLASIRQAINERVAPGEAAAPVRPPALVPRPIVRPANERPADAPEAEEPLRTVADRATARRGDESGRQEGFAGLLGGDVRLEEALARLNRTQPRSDAKAPPAVAPGEDAEDAEDADAAAEAVPSTEPKLRPTIQEWTAGSAASAAAPPASPSPAAPSTVSPSTAWQARIAAMRDKPREEADPAPPRPGVSLVHPAPPNAHKQDAQDRKDRHKEPEWMQDAARRAQRFAHISAGARPAHLTSSQAASAANAAFSRLTDSVAERSPDGERALDVLTRECLRPLLKAWLDENLPSLVERLVREEIERLARPRR